MMEVIQVKCPTCQKAVAWTTFTIFRPFCSERCKLIDLGAWAEEKHKIPVELVVFEEDHTLHK